MLTKTHKKSSNKANKNAAVRNRCNARLPQPFSFLVVVDQGNSRDHSAEPRQVLDLHLSFTPSIRSSARQLREIGNLMLRYRFLEICDSADHLHIWLLEDGKPSLFVSGLLAYREGRLNKTEMSHLDKVLRPQVTSTQHVRPYQFVAGGRLATWQDADGEESFEDLEDRVFEEVFGGFDAQSLADSEDLDGAICVEADVRQLMTLELPFEPSEKCTVSQLQYITSKLNEELGELASEYDAELNERTDAWLISNRRPTLYLTGLVDLRLGVLNKRQFNKTLVAATNCLVFDLRNSWLVEGPNADIMLKSSRSKVA